MEWDFTPDDVVQGKVAYGLTDFRADLAREVKINAPKDIPAAKAERLFALIYDLCYWLATGREMADFEREVGADPYMSVFLRMIQRHGQANVDMLGAILQRAIMQGVEAGMPLEQALQATAAWHAELTAPAARH